MSKKKIVVNKNLAEWNEQFPRTKFKTQYTEQKLFPDDPEINYQPSKTIPDDALTIPEMIKRYASGRPIYGKSGDPQYSEDEVPNFDRMDLTELADYGAHLAERLKDGLKRAQDAKAVLDKQKADEELERLVQERIKSAGGVSQHVQNPNQGTPDE